MHIYIFGSLCRGELDVDSDVDLLAVVDKKDDRFDVERYSIYSYRKLAEIWTRGAPFAWHLHRESRLVYSSDGLDYLASLGKPSPYTQGRSDCMRFYQIYCDASREFLRDRNVVFELSTMFLAVRNIATCYSLHAGLAPMFGRHAALHLGANSLTLDTDAYNALVRARMLSTRGVGDNLPASAVAAIRRADPDVRSWMINLVSGVEEA